MKPALSFSGSNSFRSIILPRTGKLSIGELRANAFVQVRGNTEAEYEDVEALAEQIAGQGLINPVTVACITNRIEVRGYNLMSQTMFGEARSLRGLVRNADMKGWNIPCAGRRRLGAAYLLETQGAKTWERYSSSRQECFQHLFPNGEIDCRIYQGITAEGAIALQLAENLTQRRPPAAKEAQAVRELWLLTKVKYPRITQEQFARGFTITVNQLQNALLIGELPADVRSRICIDQKRHRQPGEIRWGSGLILASLIRALRKYPIEDISADMRRKRTEEEVLAAFYPHVALAAILSTTEFEEHVDQFMAEIRGQANLFAGELEFELVAETVQPKKIGRSVHETTLHLMQIVETVTTALKSGEIYTNGVPYAPIDDRATQKGILALSESQRAMFELAAAVASGKDLASVMRETDQGKLYASAGAQLLRQIMDSAVADGVQEEVA